MCYWTILAALHVLHTSHYCYISKLYLMITEVSSLNQCSYFFIYSFEHFPNFHWLMWKTAIHHSEHLVGCRVGRCDHCEMMSTIRDLTVYTEDTVSNVNKQEVFLAILEFCINLRRWGTLICLVCKSLD